MDHDPGQGLPQEILRRGSLAGSEYAWRVQDIPDVIEAARLTNLLNIGGQLQFRLPGGGTCECYWVEVDTYQSVDKALPWKRRVALSAEIGLRDFRELQSKWDFVAEGRKGFSSHLDALARSGHNVSECACFVWYVTSEERERRIA